MLMRLSVAVALRDLCGDWSAKACGSWRSLISTLSLSCFSERAKQADEKPAASMQATSMKPTNERRFLSARGLVATSFSSWSAAEVGISDWVYMS